MKRIMIAMVAVTALVGAAASVTAQGEGEGFPDVPPDHSRAIDIAQAVELGGYGGYPDGTFRPDQNITPKQMATVIQRIYEREDGTTMTRGEFASFIIGGGGRLWNNPANLHVTGDRAVALDVEPQVSGLYDIDVDGEGTGVITVSLHGQEERRVGAEALTFGDDPVDYHIQKILRLEAGGLYLLEIDSKRGTRWTARVTLRAAYADDS